MSSAPPFPFHLLVKPTGAICNLRCHYCFYLDKERLYPGGGFRMTDELLENYLRHLVEAQPVSEITLAWQGGEPLLMGMDFFRRSIELQKKFQAPGRRFFNTLQTNGTLINEAWARFFHDHHFLIGISIDGPPAIHDAYRRDRAGRPTCDRVLRGLELLKKYAVAHNALVTVHRANADHPLEVYRFLRDDVGIRFLQLIPVVAKRPGRGGKEKGDGDRTTTTPSPRSCPVTDFTVTDEQWGRFLISVFDEWVRRDVGEIYVNLFDAALANWAGEAAGMCVFSAQCGRSLVLEHNGDLYSCDHFVDRHHWLGNLFQRPLSALVNSPQQRRFGREKEETLPDLCRNCRVRFACHGGCPKDRFLLTPDGQPGLNYLCRGYQRFFFHIQQPMGIMTRLLRLQRPPAEILRLYAGDQGFPKEALADVGRNDPCPCGSGKKFKYCHGG